MAAQQRLIQKANGSLASSSSSDLPKDAYSGLVYKIISVFFVL